jgi:hypothetical protein
MQSNLGHRARKAAACAALIATLSTAGAEPLPSDPQERQCWLSHTVDRTRVDLREPVSVHFSNLKNGARVRSPFWVEFGVRGMGVIPAGNAHHKAGHHHLLVDTQLPLDFTAPIPFSNTYRHFGKGQTGTEVDLPVGKHTLRLLFADHAHKPFFVFSPEISIEVTGPRLAAAPRLQPGAAGCQAWYEDLRAAPRYANGTAGQVYVKNLRDEEPVASPFVVSLGVLGLGVAPAGPVIAGTGHFRLVITQKGAVVQRLTLADGRTEAILDLALGDYEMQVALHNGAGAQLLQGEPLRLRVTRYER